MKKTLLLLCVILASIGAWAQTNLASGKTVSVVYLPSEKVAPSAEDLAKITDDNTATNVLLPNTENDIAAIAIDLTEANASTQIGTISVVQDGRHAVAYTIYGTNTAPETYATKEALTAAASAWTTLASTTNDNNGGGDNNIYTKSYAASSNSGFRYIVFVPTNQAYGVSLRQIYVYQYEAPILTTFTIAAANTTINVGNSTTTTVTKLDQFGVEFEGTPTYTSSTPAVATVGTDGVVTAVSEGTTTITASLSGKTATVDITVEAAIVWPTTAPAAPTGENVHVIYDGTTGEWSNEGWGWGSTQSDMVIDGKTCRKGENLGGMQIPNDLKDYSGYQKLVVDVWSATAHSLIVFFEGEGTTKSVDLTAGWNAIEIPLTIVTTPANVNYLTFQYQQTAPKTGILIFSNVYYSKEAAADPCVIGSVVDGIATVTGTITSSDVDDINAIDANLIDLSGITAIADAITLTPTNPNALIKVSGTVDGNLATADAKYANLTADNQVVITEWVFPTAQLQIKDANGASYWYGQGCTNNWVATGTRGFKITRKIAAGAYATACYPAAATAPTGLTVYEFTGYASNQVEFTKKTDGSMLANVPYYLHNNTESEITLEVEGTGDFSLSATKWEASTTVEKNGASFIGNKYDLVTTGTQYILSNGQIKKGNGATIGAFRAYFTGVSGPATARFFDGDETTKIGTIDAQGEIEAGKVYNLRGQRVQNPAKGLYIVNGKKVILK